jgi:hypothetical protein
LFPYCRHFLVSLAGAPRAAEKSLQRLSATLSSGMALIAVLAVVDIALHTLVVLVGLPLGVTNRAGKHRVVRWVRVAVAAGFGATVFHGEPSVVECGVQPCLSVMAGLASGREPSRLVVGVGGVVVVLLVTGVTVRGKVMVVVVHVALAAGHLRVRAGQRPAGRAVIELAIGPKDCVMTHLARLRESCRLMGRIVGVVVVGQMAGHASRVG